MALSTFRTNSVGWLRRTPGAAPARIRGAAARCSLLGAGQLHGLGGAYRRCYGSIIQRCAGGGSSVTAAPCHLLAWRGGKVMLGGAGGHRNAGA